MKSRDSKKFMVWEAQKYGLDTFQPKIFRLKSRESRDSKSPWRGKAKKNGLDTFQPKIFRLKLEKKQEHNGKKICDQPIQK